MAFLSLNIHLLRLFVQVVGGLSGIRNSTAVTTIMNDFVGRVTMADLKQVLYALGVAKEWLTALQVHQLPPFNR